MVLPRRGAEGRACAAPAQDAWASGSLVPAALAWVFVCLCGTTESCASRAGADVPAADLDAVWGSGPSDVWASGSFDATNNLPTLVHFDGTKWSASTVGATVDLAGIHGTSASDAWLAGDTGDLFHFTGTSWAATQSGTQNALSDVWPAPGGSSSDVWAVGDVGTILRHR